MNQQLSMLEPMEKTIELAGHFFLVGRLAPYECMFLFTRILSLLSDLGLEELKDSMEKDAEPSEDAQKKLITNFQKLAANIKDPKEIQVIVETCLSCVQVTRNGKSAPLLLEDAISKKKMCTLPGLSMMDQFKLIWAVLQHNVFTGGGSVLEGSLNAAL